MSLNTLRPATTRRSSIGMRPVLLGLVASLLLQGCGGSQEDVRVTLCKDLVLTRLGDAQSVQWSGTDTRLKRLEQADVTVSYQATDATGGSVTGRATCTYDYVEVEENVMAQSQPLSSYATAPYQMDFQGMRLAGKELTETINLALMNKGAEFAQEVRRGMEDASAEIRQRVSETAEEIKRKLGE